MEPFWVHWGSILGSFSRSRKSKMAILRGPFAKNCFCVSSTSITFINHEISKTVILSRQNGHFRRPKMLILKKIFGYGNHLKPLEPSWGLQWMKTPILLKIDPSKRPPSEFKNGHFAWIIRQKSILSLHIYFLFFLKPSYF